jgi:hypothetical protein
MGERRKGTGYLLGDVSEDGWADIICDISSSSVDRHQLLVNTTFYRNILSHAVMGVLAPKPPQLAADDVVFSRPTMGCASHKQRSCWIYCGITRCGAVITSLPIVT